MNADKTGCWRKSYMFIADTDQDFPNGRPMYSDKFVPVKGTALIVLNAIERMMEVKK